MLPDNVESITSGFTTMYQLLLKHRAELLADGGPLTRFADDQVRVILRATRTYALLLQESFHPVSLGTRWTGDRLAEAGIWTMFAINRCSR